MILRTSSHTIKFANTGKKVLYKKIITDYQWLLQKYIDLNKSSRQGEVYHCKTCGAEMDADINAAINILHLGVYSPQNLKAERQ